jgi:aspartyl-tRNA(Asn)/glutamyl-tRNA(Gln) amidotransferase subunit A
LTGDLSGLRIGVQRLDQFAGDSEDPAVPGLFAAAGETLSAAGADVVEIELPYYAEMAAACFLIMVAEAAAYHQPDLQSRWLDYGPGTRRMFALAFSMSAADYVQAQRARRVGQKTLAALFTDVDLVVTPTTSTVANRIDQLDTAMDDSLRSIHTLYWDTTGNPVISVPMGFGVGDLPLGLQIAGRPFDEATVLRAADAFQLRTDWHQRRPVLAERA